MEQGEELCDEVETVHEFTYLGYRVSAGGGYEDSVITRTKYRWFTFRECGEFLYGGRFPLRLDWAVYGNYVRPAILSGNVALCQKKVGWEFYEGQRDPW